MNNFAKNSRTILLFSLVFGVVGSVIAQKKFDPKSVTYLWPTDASRLASATLGETRAAHFHAGLDVKTWGRIGFKLFASRSGILYRAAKGPFGYGNVLYLKHDDGSFTVYAHMDRFTPKLDKLIDSLRWQNRVFVFDQNMESYGIYYEQGELIGYTGDTGAGPPHLHFEIRSPIESPVNALITNLSVKDRVKPQFSALAVEPLGLNSTVEGKKEILIKKPGSLRSNYSFGTIDVSGEIGLAVDVFDQADGAANALAVYELLLLVNNEILFHSRIDSFSYSNTREMFLDRVYSILKSNNRGFQRLYRRDGNTLPFYEVAKPEARLNLPQGLHEFEIQARDFFGNTSKAFGKLNVSTPEKVVEPFVKTVLAHPIEINTGFPEHIRDWEWQNNWVRPKLSGKQSELAFIKMKPLGFFEPELWWNSKSVQTQALDLTRLQSVDLTVNEKTVRLFRVKPGVKTVVTSPDQLVQVEFDKNAVYDTLSLAVGYETDSGTGQQQFYILPEQEPLKRGFTVRLMLDESYKYPEKTAFYTYNERTKRVDFANSSIKGGMLTTRLRDFGMYKILTDSIAPEIKQPRIYRKSGGRWAASVKGSDDLSGIDYNRSRFWVNDEEGILEYDPEEDKIVYYHPDFKPKKNNVLRLEIWDNSGNVLQKEINVKR
jgi:murein DD-endopeptidase MepM/ murein hydrolase activator NlpD